MFLHEEIFMSWKKPKKRRGVSCVPMIKITNGPRLRETDSGQCSALVARPKLTSFLISCKTSSRSFLPFYTPTIKYTFPELTKEGIHIVLLIFAWALVIIMNGESLDDITQSAIILMEISVMEHTRHPRPLIGQSDSQLASDWLMVTRVSGCQSPISAIAGITPELIDGAV